MASLVIFHHSPGRTLFHTLDPRFKLLLLVVVTWETLYLGPRGLGVLGLALAGALYAGRVPLFRIIKNGLPLWIIIFALFLSRALGTPGAPAANIQGLRISREGLSSGAVEAARLVYLVFAGHLFISVTSVSDIQRAIVSLLRPLPGNWGPKTALLLGLSINLVPELLDTAEEILSALASRNFPLRKHPLRGILLFASLFVGKTVGKTGRIADALEARNYRSDRSRRPLRMGRREGFSFLFILPVLTGLLFL